MAFFTKLVRMAYIFSQSVFMEASFEFNALLKRICMPFCFTSGEKKVCKYSICSFTLVSDNEISTSPASTFEMLIMSFMILSIRAPLFSMISMYSCCTSPDNLGSFKSSVNPRIPFIGVRISWLIFARKADFKRSLSSAFSLALSDSFCKRLLSVMSSLMAIK